MWSYAGPLPMEYLSDQHTELLLMLLVFWSCSSTGLFRSPETGVLQLGRLQPSYQTSAHTTPFLATPSVT